MKAPAPAIPVRAALGGLGLLLGAFGPAAHGAVAWKDALQQAPAWYASAEARAVAQSVLLYQTESGGWPKNREMTVPPAAEAAARPEAMPADEQQATIDNGATYPQLRFLARIQTAQPDEAWRAAFGRGLDYLFAAQYANGGWPQFFPLRPGYYSHITFNDDAMVGVLELLRDVARGREPFAWVGAESRARAAAAVRRGRECILRCQVVVKGVPTVWCAQHDEVTLAPAPARRFEPVSLSGYESVGLVRFLMDEDAPGSEVIAAVQAAIRWLEQARLTGLRVELVPAPGTPRGVDRRVVADPAAPPLWARFYEIGTNRPIFAGRDAVIHYQLADIEPERRGGYSYYTEAPRRLLEQDYPRWAARWLPASSR